MGDSESLVRATVNHFWGGGQKQIKRKGQTVLSSSKIFVWGGQRHIQPPATCDSQQKLKCWSHSVFTSRNPILRYSNRKVIFMGSNVNKTSYTAAELTQDLISMTAIFPRNWELIFDCRSFSWWCNCLTLYLHVVALSIVAFFFFLLMYMHKYSVLMLANKVLKCHPVKFFICSGHNPGKHFSGCL